MARKTIIRLTEADLHNIIKECINAVLKESNEHILYHNTEISTLIKMIKENKMFFSDTADRACQCRIRGGASNYMSLTRYKGDYEGYQSYNMCSVRLTIDNDRFQTIMRKATEPMEAYSPNRWGWGNKSAKAHHQGISKLTSDYINNNGNWDDDDAKYEHFGDYYNGEHVMFPEEFVQAEETMNTDKDYIDNPLRFIVRIDVRNIGPKHYAPGYDPAKELKKVLDNHPDWKRITYLHNNGLSIKD